MLALEEIIKAKDEGKSVSLVDLGYDDHVGNKHIAGMAARDVYTHWHNEGWRNAFIMAVEDFCENQYEVHQKEIHSWLAEGHQKVSKAARGAVVKSYLIQKNTKVREYTRADGTHVDAYDKHGNRRSYAVPEGEGMDQAAAMAAALSNAYSRKVGGDHQQQIAFHIQDKFGAGRVETPDAGFLPNLADGERVVRQTPIGFKAGPKDLGMGTTNLLQAMGVNYNRAGSAGAAVQHMSNIGQAHNWYQRLESMTKVMALATGEVGGGAAIGAKIGGTKGAAIGAGIGTAAAVATAIGEAVMNHGPEVSRVLGPSIRKYGYRYRGQTTTPQQYSNVARDGKQTDGQGMKENNEQFETRLAFTLASADTKKGGLNAIPSKAENALLLKTGSTAPSHGFLLNAKGEVTQQAVGGNSDDHYVPFNLSKLNTLKGGSYVRTRVYGGPTTEDFSLAMRTGANRFTTISHNGTFTVQFDPRAATKKHGYEPRAVANRYAKLLDAIKHGNVTDPETNQALKLDERGYTVALQSLKRQYPLLIASVSHSTPKDLPELGGQRGGEHEVDSGYVRPMYLKPSEARAGYYDPLLSAPGQANQSYDAIAGYRSLKATHLLMQRAAAVQAAAPVAQTPVQRQVFRERTGNTIPDNLTPAQQATGEAAGGDFGAPIESYKTAAWPAGHMALMSRSAEGIFKGYLASDDANPLDGMHKDVTAWVNIMEAAQDGEPDAVAIMDDVRTGEGDARFDLMQAVSAIAGHTEDSGLINDINVFETGLGDKELGAEEPDDVEEIGEPGAESLSRVHKDPDYKDYVKYKEYANLKQLLETNRAASGDPNLKFKKAATQEIIDHWEKNPSDDSRYASVEQSKADYWQDTGANIDDYHGDDADGTPFQQMENREARAKMLEAGKTGKLPHDPSLFGPPEGVVPDPSDHYADDALRGLDPRDLD